MTIKIPTDIDLDKSKDEFDLTIKPSETDISIDSESDVPVVAVLSIDESQTEFEVNAESNQHALTVSNDIQINVSTVDVPTYAGPYKATPKANSTVVLETKDKRCKDNITVLKVPRYQTHNEYGTTFYIAEEE